VSKSVFFSPSVVTGSPNYSEDFEEEANGKELSKEVCSSNLKVEHPGINVIVWVLDRTNNLLSSSMTHDTQIK